MSESAARTINPFHQWTKGGGGAHIRCLPSGQIHYTPVHLVYGLNVSLSTDKRKTRRYSLLFSPGLWPWGSLVHSIKVMWLVQAWNLDRFPLAVCVCVCVDAVMDDEDELINTKGLSVRLHPNLPHYVCTVGQQAETDEWERGRK